MLSPSFIPQSVFYTQSVVRSPQSMFYTDLQVFRPFWKIRDHEALNYLLSQRYLKSSETNWKTIRHTLYVKYRTQGQFWVHELDSPCICLYTFSLMSVRTSLDNSTWTNHRSHPNFGSIKGRNLLKVVKSFSSFLPEEQRCFFTTDEEATAMFTSKSNRWPHSGLDPVGSCAFWRQFYVAPWARVARWLEGFRFFEVIYLNFVGHHDPSLCPEGHLRPFRIALHPSRSLADAVAPPLPPWLPSHLLPLSLYTPPPGCPWPARSSFAFWCPGQCSFGDVIRDFKQPERGRPRGRRNLWEDWGENAVVAEIYKH